MMSGSTTGSVRINLDATNGSTGPATIRLGQPIVRLGTVSSTMDVARTLAFFGAPEGTIVLADAQRAGRGRAGRHWHSPVGAGLYATLILRPTCTPAQSTPLSIAVGLSVCDAIDPDRSRAVRIKWPNDIISPNGKVGGVLIEMSSIYSMVDHVLVGIGVNLAPHEGRPQSSAPIPSCGSEEQLEAADVIQAICGSLSRRYVHLLAGRPAAAIATWQERLLFMNEPVAVVDGPRTYHGVVAGIDDSGALLLNTSEGGQRIVAGDLTRGPKPSAGI